MIDLSNLPPPEIAESLDYQQIVVDTQAALIAIDPALEPVLALESEPMTKLIQAFAYRELLIRVRINDAAQSGLLAFATGGTLDHLGALLGTVRLDGEVDSSFRGRIQMAFERLSVAGPRQAYIENAKAADPRVTDVGVFSQSPGQVNVIVLGDTDQAADQDLLDVVSAALNHEDVRPLTDQIVVSSAQPVVIDVTASLFIDPGPDEALVTNTAQDALEAYFISIRRVGADVAFSGIAAALHQSGVSRVAISNPAGDVAISSTQAPVIGQITLSAVVNSDD
ncbi:MAG: baseplate J/gp47 family protein [Pseudomonadota bacterium]